MLPQSELDDIKSATEPSANIPAPLGINLINLDPLPVLAKALKGASLLALADFNKLAPSNLLAAAPLPSTGTALVTPGISLKPAPTPLVA